MSAWVASVSTIILSFCLRWLHGGVNTTSPENLLRVEWLFPQLRVHSSKPSKAEIRAFHQQHTLILSRTQLHYCWWSRLFHWTKVQHVLDLFLEISHCLSWQPGVNAMIARLRVFSAGWWKVAKSTERRREVRKTEKGRKWGIEADSRRGSARRGAKDRVRRSFLGRAPWSAAHSRKINWSCFFFVFFQSELPPDYRETAVHPLPPDSVLYDYASSDNQDKHSALTRAAFTPFSRSFPISQTVTHLHND